MSSKIVCIGDGNGNELVTIPYSPELFPSLYVPENMKEGDVYTFNAETTMYLNWWYTQNCLNFPKKSSYTLEMSLTELDSDKKSISKICPKEVRIVVPKLSISEISKNCEKKN